MQPEGVDQVHLRPLGLEQIGRPIPAVTRLQGHLGVGACLGHGHGQRHRVVVDLRDVEDLTGVVHPDDHRPAAMQVDPDILLLAFHQGLLPSCSAWFGDPECASHARFPSTGGALADPSFDH